MFIVLFTIGTFISSEMCKMVKATKSYLHVVEVELDLVLELPVLLVLLVHPVDRAGLVVEFEPAVDLVVEFEQAADLVRVLLVVQLLYGLPVELLLQLVTVFEPVLALVTAVVLVLVLLSLYFPVAMDLLVILQLAMAVSQSFPVQQMVSLLLVVQP